METSPHAFEFLAHDADALSTAGIPSVCILSGDETFLRRLVLQRLTQALLGDDIDDTPISTFEAKTAQWRDVRDELSTASLFGPSNRVVLIDDADDFVTLYRTQLEDYVDQPSRTATLLLAVKKWPGNTRLAKAVAKTGWTIGCRLPERSRGKNKSVDTAKLLGWLGDWAKSQHGIKLTKTAAQQLIDLTGTELGLLDQSLAKLALSVEDPKKSIDPTDVVNIVGGWRTKTTWDLLDAACDGNAGEALLQLDRILSAGEHPQAMFGAFSWSLRRFAAATRNVEAMERAGRPVRIGDALESAGFRRFPQGAIQRAESQLRQMGRERAGKLYDWLLETDVQLKGTHSAPERARYAVERLLLRLAKETKPPKKKKTVR